MKIIGIDLGISSVGWALVEENQDRKQNKIIKAGVRIFTRAENPKDGASLALPRREARGARRVIKRKRKRMYKLKKLLIETFSLQKQDLFNKEIIEEDKKNSETIYKQKNKKDVWQLRAEALNRKLSNKQFVRILTHIAKRRGYKSNAKSDTGSDDGKVLKAITQNQKEMEEKEYLTVGQFFYHKMLEESQKNNQGEISQKSKIRNSKNDYKQCVTREMLQEEIRILFKKQKEFGFVLNENFINQYNKIAFFQNPPKSVEEMIGNCTFEKEEKRAPKQCYSGELFTALTQIINHTTLIKKGNRAEEVHLLKKYDFEKIEKILWETEKITYATLRKKLSITEEYQFKQLNYSFNVESKTKLPSYEKIVEQQQWLTEQQKEIISWIPDKNNPKKQRKKKGGLNNYSDLRRRLNLSVDFQFPNLQYPQSKQEIIKKVESKEITQLKGYHAIKKKLKKELGNDNLFNKIFSDKSLFNQIGTILATEKDTEKTVERLAEEIIKSRLTISQQEQQNLIKNLKNISFDKVLHLSVKAIDKILPAMKQGQRYDESCREIYGHHSQLEGGEKKRLLRSLNKQENYQLTNPVVKRCFAQFRKVLNAIIKKYGQFDAMHIELSRELKNTKEKRDEIERGQTEFKEHKKSLAEQFQENFGRQPSAKELLKIRLHDEQTSKCIYSGKAIDYDRLIQEPNYCQVDHILPYSRTFDNSLNNKVLALTIENQGKGNKTPFEWLANKNENSEKWHEFQNRVNSFINIKGMKKRNLFNTTLTHRHGNELTEEETDKEDSFIARNLIDTQFLGKFTKNFVENNLLFKENDFIKQKVKVRSGALTSHLRYLWGLEEKNRDNHLHHAEDAVIIAFSTQSEVQRLSTYSAKFENYKFANKEEKEKMKKMRSERPFDKEQFDETINNIFVSHAPRRKVTGAAHKETLYGKNKKIEKKGEKEKITNYPVELNRDKNKKSRSYAERGNQIRADIFQYIDKNNKKKYFIVPIYVADFVKDKLSNKAIVRDKPWRTMTEEYQFIASFYKNDYIEIIRKNKPIIKGYFYNVHAGSGNVTIKKMDGYKKPLKDKNGNIKKDKDNKIITDKGEIEGIGIQNASEIIKYQVSPLGEISEVKLPEKRIGTKKQLRQKRKEKKKVVVTD